MSGYSPGKATTHWTVVDKELYVRIFASSIGHDAAFEHKQREDGALVLTLRNFTGQLVCQSEASFELGSILEKAYLGERRVKELGEHHEPLPRMCEAIAPVTQPHDDDSRNDDGDDVSQELLPAEDWATRRSLWHTLEKDPCETSGVSESVDSGVREDVEEEGAVCSTPGVPPPSTPAVAMTTSKQQPQLQPQQQPPGVGDQENRSPNPTSADKPSARKRTAGTRNAGADIRTMFTPAVKRQTTTAAAAAAAAPGAAGGLRMAWVRVNPKADKAEGTPTARWGGVAVSASASQVYVHGGLGEAACAKDVWSLKNNKWGGSDWQWQRLSRCDSDAPRAWHTAVVSESPSGSATRMITFAGEVAEADASTTTFNDVSVFDLTDQIWFTPPVTGTPPSPRAGHSAILTSPSNKLVVFGGVSGSGKHLNDIHALCTDLWNWYKPTVRNAPPKPRSYHSATAMGSHMLVFGGNGPSKSFKEVYYLDTETWAWSEPETTGELPKPRTGHTATASPDGRYVVVFGGWDTDPVRRYNDVHVLDTVTWTWHAAAVAGDAPSARCGHSACAVQVDGGKHAVLVLHGQEEDERLCACAHLLMLE